MVSLREEHLPTHSTSHYHLLFNHWWQYLDDRCIDDPSMCVVSKVRASTVAIISTSMYCDMQYSIEAGSPLAQPWL